MKISLDRSLLLGFGTGCIVASIVIGVGMAAEPQPAAVQNVEDLARKKGLLVLSPAELKQKLSIAQKKSESNTARNNTPTVLTKEADNTPANGDAVWVVIQPGLSIDETADLLLKSSVITDRAPFISAAMRTSHFIRAGVYRFPVHSNAEQILSTLTTP